MMYTVLLCFALFKTNLFNIEQLHQMMIGQPNYQICCQDYPPKIEARINGTDYSAFEKTTAHLSGSITVTCEGLLIYMPAYEQKEVAKNIHALLSKYGGEWITSDLDEQYDNVASKVANFVFDDVTER